MTKDELEKEATEYAKPLDIKYGGSFVRTTEEVKQAYLAGAEPREKRIADLEQKLEQTEKDLTDYQFNYPKIKDLEKENAELKEKLEGYERTRDKLIAMGFPTFMSCKEYAEKINKLKQQIKYWKAEYEKLFNED